MLKSIKENKWFKLGVNKKQLCIGMMLGIVAFILSNIFAKSIKAGFVFLVLFLLPSPFRIILKKKRIETIFYGVWVFAYMLMVFMCVHIVLQSGFGRMDRRDFFLNVLCGGICFCIVLIFTMRIRISCIISGFFLMIFATINFYVCEFRGVELAPIDLFSLGTAMNVVAEYVFHPNIMLFYGWILYGIIVYSGVAFCEKVLKRNAKNYLQISAITLISIIVITFGSTDLYARHWYLEGTTENGFMLNFVLGFRELYVEKPEGYDPEKISEYAELYGVDDANKDDKPPHVIVIMNESFSDIAVLGTEIQTSQAVTPFMDSLQNNTIKGYSLASVYGGNTPNSEYEFLVGNTMASLPNGSIPYQRYIDENTYSVLTSIQKRKEYKCIAMHPYYENGWSRQSVYPTLGFEQSYFIDDFKQENLVRNYVSDQEMFEKIISEYESLEDNEKLFLFGITMQNHGGYEYAGDNYEKR